MGLPGVITPTNGVCFRSLPGSRVSTDPWKSLVPLGKLPSTQSLVSAMSASTSQDIVGPEFPGIVFSFFLSRES